MIGVHQFYESFDGINIYFHVIKMSNSFFMWIGRKTAKLTDLSMSLPTYVIINYNGSV